jgi:hypothetical protein
VSTTGSDTWKALLADALRALDGLRAPFAWTFGGGSVLAIRYDHRESRDVDIFFPDAQAITFLTPRLNDTTASIARDYVEQSNSLKLSLAAGEIDFIVAPSLLGLPPVPLAFEGREVPTDATAEIVAKKLFYRAADLKVRDVVDVGVVLARDAGVGDAVRSVLASRADALRRRLEALEESFAERLRYEVTLRPAGEAAAARSLGVTRAFVKTL